MNANRNGGTEPTVTAAKHKKYSPDHYISQNSQIKSMARLYGDSNQLSINDIRQGLHAAGFDHVDKVEASGSGRFPARGKGPTNTDAAYNVTADGQALHWADFPSNDKGTIFANEPTTVSTAESAKRFEAARQAKLKAESEKLDAQQQTAQLAKAVWHVGSCSDFHQYIKTKQLAGLHGTRIEQSTGALLVPIWAPSIGLVNLQRIFVDGTKRFLKNGRIKGCYSVIGSLNSATKVLVCEGWATGATLHEKTDRPVVIAFNAGNLSPVCQALRSRFSDIEVVVCGDDDRNSKTNTGRIKAIEAAKQIGAKVAFPDLCASCNGSDFNDQANCTVRGVGAQ